MHCSSEKSADPTMTAQAIATVPKCLSSSTLNELQEIQFYFSSSQLESRTQKTKQQISRITCYRKRFLSFFSELPEDELTDLFPSVNTEKLVQVKSALGTEIWGHK